MLGAFFFTHFLHLRFSNLTIFSVGCLGIDNDDSVALRNPEPFSICLSEIGRDSVIEDVGFNGLENASFFGSP